MLFQVAYNSVFQFRKKIQCRTGKESIPQPPYFKEQLSYLSKNGSQIQTSSWSRCLQIVPFLSLTYSYWCDFRVKIYCGLLYYIKLSITPENAISPYHMLKSSCFIGVYNFSSFAFSFIYLLLLQNYLTYFKIVISLVF